MTLPTVRDPGSGRLSVSVPTHSDPLGPGWDPGLSRRGFLRGAAVAGGGLVAAGLAAAAFRCDTLGVNPGERYDVIVDCDNPGAWAFHCHILPHAEGMAGMFGMVTALIVEA